jgi:thermitase
MPNNRNLFVVLLLTLSAAPCLWAGKEFTAGPGESALPDQLIVKLHSGANINQLLASVVPQAFANLVSSQFNAYVLQLPPGIQNLISKALAASPLVDYVEPNRLRKTNIGPPNDPNYASQWALTNIQALQAWNYLPDQYLTAATAGTNRVKVAVLDTGADCTHPDFKNVGGSSADSALGGQLLFASSEALIATKVVSPTCAWQDDHGHGTHTAGIVAAATQNGTGVASVGYPLQVIVYKVLDDTGNGSDAVIALAIEAATDAGAKVVSMSLGGVGYSQTLQNAIEYAWQHNTLVVSAAGNTGDNSLMYPGAANHALGVAATDITNARAGFSTYGNWVKIAAPGVNVLSTAPTYANTLGILNYASLSGTSMATPHVAAVAGLVYMANPSLSAAAVAQQLQRSAQTPNAGWDQFIGYGVLNAAGAVSGTLRSATLGSLVGQVVDASNLPVSATVVANGQSFTTAAGDGLFRIANLSAGTYTLTATAGGFSPVNMQASVLGGSDTTGWSELRGRSDDGSLHDLVEHDDGEQWESQPDRDRQGSLSQCGNLGSGSGDGE